MKLFNNIHLYFGAGSTVPSYSGTTSQQRDASQPRSLTEKLGLPIYLEGSRKPRLAAQSFHETLRAYNVSADQLRIFKTAMNKATNSGEEQSALTLALKSMPDNTLDEKSILAIQNQLVYSYYLHYTPFSLYSKARKAALEEVKKQENNLLKRKQVVMNEDEKKQCELTAFYSYIDSAKEVEKFFPRFFALRPLISSHPRIAHSKNIQVKETKQAQLRDHITGEMQKHLKSSSDDFVLNIGFVHYLGSQPDLNSWPTQDLETINARIIKALKEYKTINFHEHCDLVLTH